MDFSEVVLKRRMVRHFSPEPLDPDALKRIMEMAQHAPSAGFTQGQSFVVVTRPELKQRIAQLCGEEAQCSLAEYYLHQLKQADE